MVGTHLSDSILDESSFWSRQPREKDERRQLGEISKINRGCRESS